MIPSESLNRLNPPMAARVFRSHDILLTQPRVDDVILWMKGFMGFKGFILLMAEILHQFIDVPGSINSHYFHIIGDGHQPTSRGLYTHYEDSY